MVPVVTPEEMRAIDAEAVEPTEVLVDRAGRAVARATLRLLGGAYGRRVVVIAGRGSNGADGRVAARRLELAGVRVALVEAGVAAIPSCDLVVDAAYGTGFHGAWESPEVGTAPVLAVDLPSGVDGLTGEVSARALEAVSTVTFAALKPGLLLGAGRALAGEVEVVDIGLDVSRACAHLVNDADVASWLPDRGQDAHKWQDAVWLVAGSPGMAGAAALAARGAQRAGAGYVRVSTPGGAPGDGIPVEAVGTVLPACGWAAEVLDGCRRFGALAVGPGLSRAEGTAAEVRSLVEGHGDLPLVVDGDGLHALGEAPSVGCGVVLTPHDGEYARLAGHAPAADRLDAARSLAATTGAVVLLKGSTTVIADPTGQVLVTATGGARLATAGTGDVLTGVLAALLATGVSPLHAAAAAAHLHGRAGNLGWRRGLVAGDLPDLLPAAFDGLRTS
ncbi:MAG: NAD(P)H-hydrate dehydratase [Acidimicrobiales bacterium]